MATAPSFPAAAADPGKLSEARLQKNNIPRHITLIIHVPDTVKTAIYNPCGQRLKFHARMMILYRKSLCGEALPAKRDQQPQDFALTEPFTWSMGP